MAEGVGGERSDIVMPGGKVDPEAVRAAVESAGDDDAALPRVVFTLGRDLKSRLDKYLTSRIAYLSRTQLQRVIEDGGVTVNGRPAKASTKLRLGDRVEVVVPPPRPRHIQPERIPIDVLYEDEHIIVLNKRADIIVHPARSELSGTMVNALAWYLEHESSGGGGGLSGVGEEFARPGVVHRLDRHTSGCIVFAKDDEAHWKLGRQFERREVDKRYLAVVRGRVEPDVDVVELPLGPHPSRAKGYREKYVVRHDDLGKHAVTIYRVRERYELPAGGGRGHPGVASSGRFYSLVELELKTGRTHQIRVHLSELGWPIVGDDMYGGRPFVAEGGEVVIDRQALHAAMLGFTHPITGEPMRFTAPLRGDVSALVAHLREHGDRENVAAPGATVDLEAATKRRDGT